MIDKSKCDNLTNLIYSTNDNEFIEFIKKREFFKQQLYQLTDFHGYLYCESLIPSNERFLYFSEKMKKAIENRTFENIHLIVCVHGLEGFLFFINIFKFYLQLIMYFLGTSEDLTAYRNYLQIAHPDQNLFFLLSKINKGKTWSNLNEMGENLLFEIESFIQNMPIPPTKISYIFFCFKIN